MGLGIARLRHLPAVSPMTACAIVRIERLTIRDNLGCCANSAPSPAIGSGHTFVHESPVSLHPLLLARPHVALSPVWHAFGPNVTGTHRTMTPPVFSLLLCTSRRSDDTE